MKLGGVPIFRLWNRFFRRRHDVLRGNAVAGNYVVPSSHYYHLIVLVPAVKAIAQKVVIDGCFNNCKNYRFGTRL